MDANQYTPPIQATTVAAPIPPEPEVPAESLRLAGGVVLFLVEVFLCAKDVLLALGLIVGLDTLQLRLHGGELNPAIWEQGTLLLLLIGVAIPLVYLALFVHEGGHALAGRLVGFWFVSLRVRSFNFIRSRRGIRFELSELPETGLEAIPTGGEVVSLPVGDTSLRWRQGVMVAGGPLASLVLALLAWGLLTVVQRSCCSVSDTSADDVFSVLVAASPGTRLVLWMLALLAAKSAITLVGAILPYKWGRIESDGWLLLSLWSGGSEVDVRLLLAAIKSYSLRRVRPREWPPDLAARAATLAEGSRYGHLAALYAYSWAVDSGVSSAGLLLDRALATCPNPAMPPPALAFEAAYFEARYRQNSIAARAWLGRATGRGSEFAPVLGPRAEAALFLLEGQPQAAYERASEGLAAHQRQSAGGPLAPFWLEAEQLRDLQAEALQHGAITPTFLP